MSPDLPRVRIGAHGLGGRFGVDGTFRLRGVPQGRTAVFGGHRWFVVVIVGFENLVLDTGVKDASLTVEVLHVVLIVFLVANARGGWVDVDNGPSSAVNGLVGQHLTGEVVSISIHGRKPPHRFEGHNFLDADLLVNRPRQLAHVFQTSLFGNSRIFRFHSSSLRE